MRIAAHDYNNDAEIDALTTALRSAR
jgi:selenocysteine lyase/cysteine desulfurase